MFQMMNDFLRISQQKAPDPKQLILIKYPAIVKNVENAIQTMGGLTQISSAHFNNHSLELSHTPDNPYTSRIIAERKNQDVVSSGTLHMVMKVKRKKSDPSKVRTKFIGMVDTVYSFDVMCDFQYLPVKKRTGTEGFDDLIPKLIPTDLPSALCWWNQTQPEATPLFLPPYQFSRYLTPSTKILGRETDHTEKTRRAVRSGYGRNLRVERKALSVTVMATDEFPLAPSQEVVDDALFRCKHDEPHRLLSALDKYVSITTSTCSWAPKLHLSMYRPQCETSAECKDDIVIVVDVITPYNRILQTSELRSSRLLKPVLKLLLRGDTLLRDLRQKLSCPCDTVVPLENGFELEPMNFGNSTAELFPSSFIFIHETFYVDDSNPKAIDISL